MAIKYPFWHGSGNPLDLPDRIKNLTEVEQNIVEEQVNLTIRALHTGNK